MWSEIELSYLCIQPGRCYNYAYVCVIEKECLRKVRSRATLINLAYFTYISSTGRNYNKWECWCFLKCAYFVCGCVCSSQRSIHQNFLLSAYWFVQTWFCQLFLILSSDSRQIQLDEFHWVKAWEISYSGFYAQLWTRCVRTDSISGSKLFKFDIVKHTTPKLKLW